MDHTYPERMKWWTDARFGMFVHWGLPTVEERGFWLQFWEHIPVEEYAELADRFNPADYDPARWVKTARDAGAKYMVLTTRNHDGFCIFDTKTSDFNSVKTGAGRDLVAEFAEACHAAGMRMGFYYSLQNWRHPGCLTKRALGGYEFYRELVEESHEQIRELLTNYGQVDVLWYDGLRPSDPGIWRSDEMNAMARELQPGIIINNRNGLPGDYGTPENTIQAETRPWEACFTMNETWGYAPGDETWKTVPQLLNLLARCASGGGNLLLNCPPDKDGRMPAEGLDRLQAVGEWMKVNGEAIRGSERAPIAPGQGYCTLKDGKLYLIVVRWPGSTLSIAWLRNRITRATLLWTGQEARIEEKGDRKWLHGFPEKPPCPLPVIKIEVEGAPEREDPENHMTT